MLPAGPGEPPHFHGGNFFSKVRPKLCLKYQFSSKKMKLGVKNRVGTKTWELGSDNSRKAI